MMDNEKIIEAVRMSEIKKSPEELDPDGYVLHVGENLTTHIQEFPRTGTIQITLKRKAAGS